MHEVPATLSFLKSRYHSLSLDQISTKNDNLDLNSLIMHKLINYAWTIINLVIFVIKMSFPINGPILMSNGQPL